MKYSNFDFEQQILQCWGIVEDLQTTCDLLSETTQKERQILDILNGISQLYDARFSKLFKLYESMIHANNKQ